MAATQEVRLPAVLTQRLLKIPDCKRPYAWRRKQLEYIWEDLDLLGPGDSQSVGTPEALAPATTPRAAGVTDP